jgi:hypothetical protein
MFRSKMVMFSLTMACLAGMLLPATAQATFLTVSADTQIMPRADLIGDNAGANPVVGIGGEDTWAKQDRTHGLFRWDLSSVGSATGDVTITFNHDQSNAEHPNPRNFVGETLDLYQMPLNNADWEEGTGLATADAGAAWNRKKGAYSTSPPDADKWLPTGSNDPHSGISLVQSYTWQGTEVGNVLTYTIPAATFNGWVADGVVSLLLRSDSVDAKLLSGDTTQRLWMVASREQSGGSLAPTMSGDFATVPEPASVVMVITGVLGLLAYAWRKRK